MTTTFTVKTRSTAPYALLHVHYHPAVYEPVGSMHKVKEAEPYAASLVGYAHSTGPAVVARARKLGARIVPIIAGKAEVTV